ncbi:hypothetical protein D3C76_1506430 [compost metagenome]
MQANGLASLYKLLVCNVLLIVNQVLFDGTLKQPGILQDHTEQIMNVLSRKAADRRIIDVDFSAR